MVVGARVLAACVLLASLAVAPASAAPANDDFAAAAPALVPGAVVADLSSATREPDEPIGCDWFPDPLVVSVWYRVEVPADMRLAIRSLSNTTHDVNVYTGTSLADLRLIGCAASSFLGGGVDLLARVSVGEPTFIQVTGRGGNPISLSLRPGIGGDIVGTVTTTSGDPIPEVCIFALDQRLGRSDALSHADGTFIITVPPGSYAVHFFPCRDRRYIAQAYDGADFADATPVDVGPNETRSGIDATLVRYAIIRGTVTDLEGEPVSRVCINGWPEGGAPGDVFEPIFGGEFAMHVPPGAYRLNFGNCFDDDVQYQGEWYDDQPSFSTAEVVEVLEAEDLTLRPVALAPRAG